MRPEYKSAHRFGLFAMVVWFAVPALFLGAQEPTASSTVLAPLDKAEWTVGFALLEHQDRISGIQSAASLIPRLLLDDLGSVGVHRLSDEERSYWAEEYLEREILKLYADLSRNYARRDDLFFDPNLDPEVLRDIENDINTGHVALAIRKSYPIDGVPVPSELPVVIVGPMSGGDLWEPVGTDPDAVRDEAGLDCLIGGALTRVGDYFGLRIAAYTAVGTEILWEGAVGGENLEAAAGEAASVGRGLLLGRPWAGLSISTEPADAVIYVDGHAVGVGTYRSADFVPGTVTVEISAGGYRPVSMELNLEPGKIQALEVPLAESVRETILVRSDPTGADVRIGSVWLGRTPLPVTLPEALVSVTLEKEGFRRRTVPLYPDTRRLTVPLENAIADPLEELAVARKKLHNSIAWFSVSLAPTIILMGVSQNYANMNFNSTDPGDLRDSYDAYRTTRGFMWGSVGVNALLLTHVLYRLSRYLKSAENLSEG